MTDPVTVSLLGMGGTISTVPHPEGARAGRSSGQLIEGLSLDARIRPRDVCTTSSRAVTPDDMWTLAHAVEEELTAGTGAENRKMPVAA